MTPPGFRLHRLFFPLIWLMFMVKSLVYVSVTPMWEGFDELFHFAYVHSLAATHSLPVWGETFVDADIAKSTAYTPMGDWMPQLAPGAEKLSYRDYWRMDEEERAKLEENLSGLTASAKRYEPSDTPLYQIQHPPLYYLLCMPLYKAMDGRSIVSKVFVLRVFSVLLASLVVVAAALIARKIDPPLGRMAAVLAALWPCLYIDIARVGNDSLSIAILSFIFCLMVLYATNRSVKLAVALGICLGLGLLTKVYFLICVPAIVFFAALSAYRDKEGRKEILRDAGLVLVCAGFVGGWWYLRSYFLYGSFSGLQETLRAPDFGGADRIGAIVSIPWVVVIKHLFVSFCWIGGWSFLKLPKVAYLVFVFVFSFAIFGFGKLISAPERRRTLPAVERNGFLAAVCLAIFFGLGIAYHSINVYTTMGFVGGSGGWYFYALVLPISFLVALGVREAWPGYARQIFVAGCVAIVLVEMYSVVAVLAPYYSGIAIPSPGGWGVSFADSPALIFSGQTIARLLVNKPQVLSADVLVFLAIACGLIHLAVLWCVTVSAGDVPAGTIRES